MINKAWRYCETYSKISHRLFEFTNSLNTMSLFSFSVRGWARIRLLCSLLCICILLVSSCANNQASNPSADSSGNGRITIGTTAKPRTLDPADAYELSSLSLVYNMSDRLYTYAPGSTELKPELATALPTVSDDGLTYTIPIRKGVVFHDDTKFDAKAMEFSLRRFIENKGKPSYPNLVLLNMRPGTLT